MHTQRTLIILTGVIIPAAAALAGGFQIDWWTVDGGGRMDVAGGDFTLQGTMGQHDAGPVVMPMTGGNFSLVGGFWGVATICGCPGDTNHDGRRDGRDIQAFVQCLTQGGSCSCADMDGGNGPDAGDVESFVAGLLAGDSCP